MREREERELGMGDVGHRGEDARRRAGFRVERDERDMLVGEPVRGNEVHSLLVS